MSDPASASQTLREQIASDLATWRELAWESSEHPGFDWAALVKAGTALAHRLASLEQQVTVVDDLPICGAECEAIADRLEAAEAQVASLEEERGLLEARLEGIANALDDVGAPDHYPPDGPALTLGERVRDIVQWERQQHQETRGTVAAWKQVALGPAFAEDWQEPQEPLTVVELLRSVDCSTPGRPHRAEIYQIGRLRLLVCQHCARHQGVSDHDFSQHDAVASLEQPISSPLKLAERFHETYERLAPQFGYETRRETRRFDADSPNGHLMIAVCHELLASLERLPYESELLQLIATLRTQVASLEQAQHALRGEVKMWKDWCAKAQIEQQVLRTELEQLAGRWRDEAREEAADRSPGWTGAEAKLSACAEELQDALTTAITENAGHNQ